MRLNFSYEDKEQAMKIGTLPRGALITSKKIGGFHTLCADVGTISGHPLSGYQAGDILPPSVWCLNHRPHSSPEGMVYDPSTAIWVDIYLQSGMGEHTRSAYNVPITTGRSYTDHVTDMLRVKKSLLSDVEFASAMYGSNDKTSITGKQSPSPQTSGGHVDTANRRMISHIGCEEGSGYAWQYLSGTFPLQTQSSVALWSSSSKTEMHVLLGGGDFTNEEANGQFSRTAMKVTDSNDQVCARGCSRSRHF